jgi:uncharacterized protein (TIGR02145 family)
MSYELRTNSTVLSERANLYRQYPPDTVTVTNESFKILENMRRKAIFCMLALIIMSAASVKAQVTIGSMNDPHGGAVLDLSKAEGESVGFLLPRVSLENVNAWQIGGDKAQGEGMAVYNTNNYVVGGEGIGIYMWNGYAWTRVKTGADDACPRVVKDSENNIYSTGWFGDAGCWMTQNLRSTENNIYTDLTANDNPGTDRSLKYYWYPSGEKTIFDTYPEYGLLYTWAAATGRTNITANEGNIDHEPHQGICPDGWHLPSDYEWRQLTGVISSSATGEYSTTTGTGNTSTKMKSTTKVAATTEFPNPEDPRGTSKSRTANGFDALLVSNVQHGSANEYGDFALFWSSSSDSNSSAWYLDMYCGSTGVSHSAIGKHLMGSVRCKKNDN